MKLASDRPIPSEADVVVVGTGAGGAPLAARLAEAGVSVLMLEAGAEHAPLSHTPDETASGPIYWTEERLSGGSDPTAFGANNSGTGVGGSTLHWGAFVPRPDARQLRMGEEHPDARNWPFGIDTLRPWLEDVERTLGVSGPADYPWDPERRYPLPPVARNAPADAVARGCEALGLRCTDAPAALVSRDKTDGPVHRSACVNCGSCHQGCRNGAKVSMDVTYLASARRAGATICARTRVVDIERDAAGRVTAVVCVRDGARHRIACGQLVLAAGGVETPRLLLHTGLANGSGQVGRNFMAHMALQVWGRFDAYMGMQRGYPSSLICEDMLAPGIGDFVGGYLLQSLGVQPVTLAETMTRGAGLWGRDLVELMDGYAHLGGIGMNGDCLPHAGNRLTLSDEQDAFGVPKARIDFSLQDNDRAMIAHAEKTMREIMTAAGATGLLTAGRTAHTIGTCRMGDDPDDAVVDGFGRSHDVANLWISDNSTFPSALAANPALTIMALSRRTAERMLETRRRA